MTTFAPMRLLARGRATRIAAVAAAAGVVVLAIALVDRESNLIAVVLLGAAIVVGELLELRPPLRAPIPLSFAYFVVLAREASVLEFVVTVVIAELVAFAIRLRPERWWWRFRLLVERLLCAAAVVVVFDSLVHDDGELIVLLGAFAAIVAALALAEVMRAFQSVVRTRSGRPPRVRWSLTDRSADLTIASSAVLMTAASQGLDGDGEFGLWGVVLFSVPLFMAWYSFERLSSARSAYDQTVHALSAVPEIGGWVDVGHADRVAELAIVAGEELGLDAGELDRVTTAALLRDLGRVCLDDPIADDDAEVARVGSAVLRATPVLAPAAAVLVAEVEETSDPEDALAGRILGACQALDTSTDGGWATSWESARAGLAALAGTQDEAVVDALGRGLRRRLPA